ncbi:hypothetical protein Desti_3005 [Desulfomonile tiedjei DSM 6799]|uniref:Uncharacterized protein n=1 Tax=Desulfomonile tiedjei (strain ATCC 49306 / DSM 6799 / DCB-1) TaxID=706587 RepID=I4C7X9_DESTA|nr:hypothetical protein Desti_3005 [Desulfomonile tiedjei DSM 6799]
MSTLIWADTQVRPLQLGRKADEKIVPRFTIRVGAGLVPALPRMTGTEAGHYRAPTRGAPTIRMSGSTRIRVTIWMNFDF